MSRDGRAGIDAALVRRLVAAQFPQWRDLPVVPVETDGWDNRTYRLGAELTVRLPTDAGYVPAIAKEDRWLPVLAPRLPVPIPVPVATGAPGEGYPHPWSVRRWIDGATADAVPDPVGFAHDVAAFVLALQGIDASDGPTAGAHSFFRGAPPSHYDDETRAAVVTLGERIDGAAALAVWDDALAAGYAGPARWFHGDLAVGNLVTRDGRLSAVLDFGTCGVGDPACDLVIAYTMFDGPSRAAFRAALGADDAMWARARGWALWKALITLAAGRDVAATRGLSGRCWPRLR